MPIQRDLICMAFPAVIKYIQWINRLQEYMCGKEMENHVCIFRVPEKGGVKSKYQHCQAVGLKRCGAQLHPENAWR